MGSRLLLCFTFFLFHLFLSSASSVVAEKPPLEAIHRNRKLERREEWIPSAPSLYATQLDTVPIVNPTPPGTTTPIVNPITTPPSPTTTEPTLPPPTPTSTTTQPTAPTTTQPTTPTTPTTTQPTTPTTTPGSSGGSWCVANPSASPTALQVALDYACGYGGADCSALQSGASCYNPNTVRDHASYAFNDYFHKNPAPTSCVFGGTAQLTSTDPSSGSCRYPSSTTGSTSTSPPATMTPPATPTMPMTPSIMTPGIMTPDSTVYGAEPTGLPSSATSVSCSLLLLFITTGFVGSLVTDKYL